MKDYASHANALAVQRDYCISAHAHMLNLGDMEQGDWLCINVDKHAAVRDFPTEDLMRTHWKERHAWHCDARGGQTLRGA